MEIKNLSEADILRSRGTSHLGEGINRIKFRKVKCRQDFFDVNGNLIYAKGQEYKIWIVRYIDTVLGVDKDFTALPHAAHESNPWFNYWYVVPIETFGEYRNAPLAEYLELDGEQYRLIADVNNGTYVLVPSWVLQQEAVLQMMINQLGGDWTNYRLRGRFLRTNGFQYIAWFITKRVDKISTNYFFDVAKQQLIEWHESDESIWTSISSGNSWFRIGYNKVKANSKEIIFKLR